LADDVQSDNGRWIGIEVDKHAAQSDEQGCQSHEHVLLKSDTVDAMGEKNENETSDEAANIQNDKAVNRGVKELVIDAGAGSVIGFPIRCCVTKV
jgi:hypothetical protein